MIELIQARYHLPAGVVARDGGTLGLHLLPDLEGVEQLIIIDAIQRDQPPGTIVRLEETQLPTALSPKLSLHQCGLGELLALATALDMRPARIILWGIVPASTAPGLDMSPVVAAQLEVLIDAIVKDAGIAASVKLC